VVATFEADSDLNSPLDDWGFWDGGGAAVREMGLLVLQLFAGIDATGLLHFGSCSSLGTSSKLLHCGKVRVSLHFGRRGEVCLLWLTYL
jgi:hypothetical protein